ncbi:MAG: hypothetical protein Q9193_005938 [Seirophora villosa]
MSRAIVPSSLRAPLARSNRSQPSRFLRYYATSDRASDKVPTNDPNPPERVQNVSETNETPISAMGLRDKPFQEMTEDSKKQREMQAPNRSEPWSRSQAPRERAMSGPRFEQTIMEYQVSEQLLTQPTSITDTICRVYRRLLTPLNRREPLERYPNPKECLMNHLGKDDL